MTSKLTNAELLAYIKWHPKSTNRALADHFKLDPAAMAARTGSLFKQARVTREIVARTASNVAIFGYSFMSDRTKVQRTRENVKGAVSITQENVRVEMAMAAKPRQPDNHVGMSEPLSINASMNALADGLANALLGMVKARLVDQLGELAGALPESPVITTEELLARVRPALPAPKPAMLKALVTGLLPVQQGEIAQDFRDAYEIRFWNGDGADSLKAGCQWADVVFFHTNHTSHNTQDMIKRAAGKKLRFVNGGVSAMKDAMTDQFCKGVHHGS